MFKAYKITDIYSRMIVGWRVGDREADHLAVQMFAAAFTEHGAPTVAHADSGSAMTSNLLRDYLHEQGVELSHNRPYTSNDIDPHLLNVLGTCRFLENPTNVLLIIDELGYLPLPTEAASALFQVVTQGGVIASKQHSRSAGV